MAIWWFAVFIVLLLIELITVNLVTIWFALGALAAIGISMVVDSFALQLVIFAVVSLVALIITKPLVKKFRINEVVPTNSDRVIGKIGTVTKEIKKDAYGEVKVYGNTWTASSNKKITVGSKVKVTAIEGVKLIVEEEED